MMQLPTIDHERRLWHGGARVVAGADEVGRGALAGPVVAAAVVLAPGVRLPGVRDSKTLSRAQRVRLFHAIVDSALGWAVGASDNTFIDRHGIVPATDRALRQALAGLRCRPEQMLVDGNHMPNGINGSCIVKGDALVMSIAAASIIAKVWRDRLMAQYDTLHPVYGFARHVGYGTRAHYVALAKHGTCPLHRRTFLRDSLSL